MLRMNTILHVVLIWSFLQFGQSYGRSRPARPLQTIQSLSPPQKTEDESLSSPPSPPVTVLEVRRELMGSEAKYSVKYQQNAEDLTIVWYDMVSETYLEPSDSDFGDDTRETSVLVSIDIDDDTAGNRTYRGRFFIQFYSEDGYGVMLDVMNVDEDVTQTDITLPMFRTEPSGDFVYEEGHDLIIKVSIPPDENGDNFASSWPKTDLQTFLLDSHSGEVEVGDLPGSKVDIIGAQSFSDRYEWTIKVKTSQNNICGLVDLYTYNEDETGSDLVRKVKFGRLITLRASTQDGPFPAGYLEFVTQPWDYTVKTDYGTLKPCSRDYSESCSFNCLAVAGDGISEVEIFKVEQDGTKTPLSSMPRFTELRVPSENKYFKAVSVRFPMSTTIEMDRERFQCVATSLTGETVTSEIVTEYYTQPEILTESTVEILHSKDPSGPLEVQIVCKVKGQPQPNITFTLARWGSYDYGVTPDEIVDEGDGVVSAKKYLTYDRSDRFSYPGKLSVASCEALTGPPYYGYAYYDMSIPTELQY